MLERLVVTDFQAHAKFAVNLGPVTTFVGASDVGKSALLRAIRWVCENRPQGDGFVRDGATTTTVALRVDGQWVVRKRGKSENVYELDGEVYHALKSTAVPDAVAGLLNTSPVNFQSQLDAPFWLADSAGEVSRNLNAVIDLGEIDEVLARAAADVRRLRSEIEIIEGRSNAASVKRDALAWAVDADSALRELEDTDAEWRETEQTVAELRAVLEKLDGYEDALLELDRAAVAGRTLVTMGEELVQLAAERTALAGVLDALERHVAIVTVDPADDWTALMATRGRGDEMAEARRGLEFLLADLERVEGESCRYEAELEKASAELEKAAGGRCPLCLQPANLDRLRSSHPICTSPTDAPERAGREPVRIGTRPRRTP